MSEHEHSDSENDSMLFDGQQNEPEYYFYGKNIEANGNEEVEIGLGQKLRITSIALAAGKKTETSVSVCTNGEEEEKFTLCTLGTSHPQFNVDLTFGVAESPVKFFVSGSTGVTLIGEMEIVEDEDDLEMDNEHDMPEGLVTGESEDEMEDVQGKAKQAQGEKKAQPKGEKKEESKTEKNQGAAAKSNDKKQPAKAPQGKGEKKDQPKSEQPKSEQPKSEQNKGQKDNKNQQGDNKNKGNQQGQNKSPAQKNGGQQQKPKSDTPKGGNKRANDGEESASKKQKV